jgi:hypothetical protein
MSSSDAQRYENHGGEGYSVYGGFYSTTKHKCYEDVHFIFTYPEKNTDSVYKTG